ncbi:MAK10-like protein [Tanacetum coccineum]
MEAHLALTQPFQVNKVTTSCEICSGPHDTQYCMENLEQAFVEYASSRTEEAEGKWYTFKSEQNNLGDTYNPSLKSHPNLRWRQPQNSQNNFSNPPNRFQPNGSIPNRSFNNRPQNFNNQSNLEGLVSNFMASQDARLSKFEADFKQQQSKMTNKIDTVLKAITDRIAGALPSDTVKNPKLSTSLVLPSCSYPTIDPQCSSHPSTSINVVKAHSKEATISQTNLPQYGMEIKPQQLDEPVPTLEDEFQDLHLNLPIMELKTFEILADLESCVNIIPLYHFKKLNIELLIVKDVEVYIGKLKLLNDFYVIDMKKDPKTPLLVGRGFLATANAVIDCKMGKIAVGEGITRSVFGVKRIDLGAQTPYYARKDFLGCHLPREWEISRDSELNPFKDTLVFRRMVEFLGAIPINLKNNIWEWESLIENPINWDKPPKNGDGSWHTKTKKIREEE